MCLYGILLTLLLVHSGAFGVLAKNESFEEPLKKLQNTLQTLWQDMNSLNSSLEASDIRCPASAGDVAQQQILLDLQEQHKKVLKELEAKCELNLLEKEKNLQMDNQQTLLTVQHRQDQILDQMQRDEMDRQKNKDKETELELTLVELQQQNDEIIGQLSKMQEKIGEKSNNKDAEWKEKQMQILAQLQQNHEQILGARQSKDAVRLPESCVEALAATKKSGTYLIQPIHFVEGFEVWCENDFYGGGWVSILRRVDEKEDFNRNWSDYKCGFGDLDANHWLGLDKLHIITASAPQEILIRIEDFKNEKRYARYDLFEIASEYDLYNITQVGTFSGDAGDALGTHAGYKFTTFDQDNDDSIDQNCAGLYSGGWWYNKCFRSHLTGEYLRGEKEIEETNGRGICWNTYRKHFSLKYAEMLVRPI